MRRLLTCVALGVLGVVLCAPPASAQGGGREFLEKMSGPGLQGNDFRITVMCFGTSEGPRWAAPRNQDERNDDPDKFCMEAGWASFTNTGRADEGLLVSAQRLEAAFVFPLSRKEWLRPLEPGFAIGAIGFLDDVNREWRMVFSPRLGVRPLQWFVEGEARRRGAVSLLQITFKGYFFIPRIRDTDIGQGIYGPFSHAWLSGLTISVDAAQIWGIR